MRHYSNARFVLGRIIDVNEGRLTPEQAQNQIDIIGINSASEDVLQTEEEVFVNPANGQRIKWDSDTKQWVPVGVNSG